MPAMLRSPEAVPHACFTFHSARMRMKQVTAEELAAEPETDRGPHINSALTLDVAARPGRV